MAYNSAIIGCGNIGCGLKTKINPWDIYTHAGAYAKCPKTNLVALCDTHLNNATEASVVWSVKNVHSNVDLLFDQNDLDIVSICTPDNTHYPLIKHILKNYNIRCIFAEKPLALNSMDAENLVNLAHDNGVMLVVNYSRRYDLMHQKIKKALSNDIIGNIQSVNGYYTKGTFHNGTHWFDLARFFFGEFVSVIGYDSCHEKSDDPTYDVKINFCNGSSGYLHSCDKNAYTIFEMDILGKKGRIRIFDSGHNCEYYNVGNSPYYSGYSNLLFGKRSKSGMKNTLYNAIADIVSSLDTGRKPECCGTDGLIAVKIAEAVSNSVKTGSSLCTIF